MWGISKFYRKGQVHNLEKHLEKQHHTGNCFLLTSVRNLCMQLDIGNFIFPQQNTLRNKFIMSTICSLSSSSSDMAVCFQAGKLHISQQLFLAPKSIVIQSKQVRFTLGMSQSDLQNQGPYGHFFPLIRGRQF